MSVVVNINDRIKNRKIKFFNDVKITSRYDRAGSTFQINYFFNPDNPEHKEFSCVGHYHLCTIDDEVAGVSERLLTGIFLSQGFQDRPEPVMHAVGGYSLPGVLEDCQVPPGVSLETDGLTLTQIVDKFLNPFGIKYSISSSASSLMNEKIEDAKTRPSQTVMSHLVDLCSQKGIIITNNEYGALVFNKPVKTRPIANFKRGDVGILDWGLVFNGQGMHSQIWAMAQQDDDETNAAQSPPLTNPFVPIVFRPRVVVQTAGTDLDTSRVAANALQDELKNFQVSLTLNSWRINGKLVKPGQIISLTNPYIYLYKKMDMIIDSVEYAADHTQQIATLNCVPPEAYTGGTPVYPFAGINLH